MDSSRSLAAVAAAVATVLAAAPAAHAMTDAEPAPAERHRAVVDLGGCTGTLIAADRVLTAAHCVGRIEEMPRIVGRRVVAMSMHPRYLASRAAGASEHGGERSDLAILRLSAPVRGVAPLALLEPAQRKKLDVGRRLTALGYGMTRRRALDWGRLRAADMRVADQEACGRRWQRIGGVYARTWEAASMLCVVDADGRRPYAAACLGDSGGPLLVRAAGRVRVAAVIAWGRRCGELGDPSVATRVADDPFVRQRHLVWAPRARSSRPTLDGDPRVGGTLTCRTAGWDGGPELVEYEFQINRAGGVVRSTSPTYTLQAADRGRAVTCLAIASNAGGRTITQAAPRVLVR